VTNDVGELKQYVVAHARAQRLSRADYRAVLDRITGDDDGAEGSWAVEWSRAGRALESRDRMLEAVRFFTMARFPYVDGPARQDALERSVAAFDRWRSATTTIERLDVPVPDGGRVRCWTSGLTGDGRPLVLVSGGIVSTKEQWAPLLPLLGRLGFAGVVTEMPGVGENTLRYTADSWQMLSHILDAVRDRADVSRTHAVCLSFSGHMALRAALDDARIRSIITVGAPVAAFFTDPAWQRRLPRVTVDTLAHITGTKDADGEADVLGRMAGWALTGERLGSLRIPVHYLASRRDEIIPPDDPLLLRRHVRHLSLLENDDVHGSPRHAMESRLWVLLSLLRARGTRDPRTAALAGLLATLRARHRLAGPRI
jgi:esterase FrsA